MESTYICIKLTVNASSMVSAPQNPRTTPVAMASVRGVDKPKEKIPILYIHVHVNK